MGKSVNRKELDDRAVGRLSQYVGELRIVGRSITNTCPRKDEIEDPVIYRAGGERSRPTPSDAFYLSRLGKKVYRMYVAFEEVFTNGS